MLPLSLLWLLATVAVFFSGRRIGRLQTIMWLKTHWDGHPGRTLDEEIDRTELMERLERW